MEPERSKINDHGKNNPFIVATVMPLENCCRRLYKKTKCTIRYSTTFFLYTVIAITTIQQQFGVEAFSRRNPSFNQTKIQLGNLVWKSTNSETNNPFKTYKLRNVFRISNHSSESRKSIAMLNRYKDLKETLRKELIETLPWGLIDDAPHENQTSHIDSDIDKAMHFLDTHTLPNEKAWRRKLQTFVALKEASEGLQNKKSPPYFPEGQMEKLLENDPDLLEEMLLADGASEGNYANAMEIYQEIYSESDCVDDPDYPILHKMAVAIALVHASPVVQTIPLEPPEGDIPEDVVDPVRRYLNYETAYMEGELDPEFDTLSIFELRFVVDGDEPDEVAAWGRKTLRNFYPDHVLQRNPDWLYANIVRTDVPYGSFRVKDDDPKLHKYQNILRNGGICGRRAFFGRFILRAFGIPTTARPSKGHGSLVHRRPGDGTWVVNLGAGWGKGWTMTRYEKDLDFEATTRARQHPISYQKVKLAQWIGDLFDEPRVYGICNKREKGKREAVLLDLQKKSNIGLWYRLSLKIQESILATTTNNNKTTNQRKLKSSPGDSIIEVATKAKIVKGSLSCCVEESGMTGTHITIRIPASSYNNPRKTKDVKVMKGILNSTDQEDFNNHPKMGNEQIYLPSFMPSGTTIMRGGTWKNDVCTSGSRLLSGGYGGYEDWGLRAAMTADSGEDEDGACPEPEITVALSDSVSMELVYIPPGRFVMGGHSTKDGRFNCVEVPHHPVEITKGFYIGKYPVTQDQYMAAMNGKNPSKSTKDPKCPVDNIKVEYAKAFCDASSELTGANIRLPTEAEWEYAARGTTNGTSADPQCFFGEDVSKLGDYAWCKSNSNGKSHPVGLKKPNPFGLYDIYGNVCERISDTYHKDYYGQGKGGWMVDPTGPSQGTKSELNYDIPNVPESGRYLLTARVCTCTVNQRLMVSTSNHDDDEGKALKLPYTLGDWKDSEPVTLELTKGNNILYFWRDAPPQYGISIREFVLTKTQ